MPGARDPEGVGPALHLLERAPYALWYLEGADHLLRAANRAARSLSDTGAGEPPDGWDVTARIGPAAREAVDEAFHTGRERTVRQFVATATDMLALYDFRAIPDTGPDGDVRGVVLSADQVAGPRARQGVATDRERETVLRLQRRLLPDQLPLLPHLQVSAHTDTPLSQGSEGGDWFDAVALPGGGLALLVGDVVGTGADATAALGQLRAVAGHTLARGVGPEVALTELDRYAARSPHARGSTVVVAAIDPATGTISAARRGHPPPLVISAGGESRYIDLPPAPPLGFRGTSSLVSQQLASGDIVVLFSSALVQSLSVAPLKALALFERVAAEVVQDRVPVAPASVAELPSRLLEKASGYLGGLEDDGTVLVVRYDAAPPPTAAYRAPLTSHSVVEIPRRLAHWLGSLGASEADVFALRNAAAQALADTVADTATTSSPVALDMEAHLDGDGVAVVTLSDESDWLARRDPRRSVESGPDDRGRGLITMLELVDDMQVERTPVGTVVRLRKRLGTPPVFRRHGAAGRVAAGQPVGLDVWLERTGGRRVLHLRGAVTGQTADELRLAVLAASHGSLEPVDVDLSEVTHLGSAGVRLLHSLVTGGSIALHAPTGSPAQAAMVRAALPYRAPRAATA